jgi:ABC-type Fe3+ transport system substrate-binding protein
VRLAHQGLVYNTTVFPAGQGPKSWDDLLNPKLKGKLAWSESTGTGGPLLITYFRQVWGEDKALDFVKKLQAQDIRIGAANSQGIIDQVIAGQYDVGVSITLNDIAITKDKGAPIEGVAPEPVLTQTNSIQIIKGAPSSHAAMLFTEFMLSKDGGQKVLREAAYIPAHPAVDPLPSMAWTLPRLSGKKEFVDEPSKTLALMPRSQEIFSQMFKR